MATKKIKAADLFCGAGGTSTGLGQAAAMGFPADYKITGNRAEQVRQIGNAVEVNQARELCRQMMEAA